MKRNYLIILLLFSLTAPFLSCQKYLDIVEKSNYRPVSTASDCQLLLDNYGTMNSNYPSDMLISSDDYFIADKDYGTVAGNTENLGLYQWDKNALHASAGATWQQPYTVILTANLVLEQVDKLRGGQDAASVLDGLEGEALFYRAYNFWLLAQMYAHPYQPAAANTDAGIPLRLTSDLNEVTTRGTVKTTYDKIVSDLTRAVTLLPAKALVVSRPGQAAVYAMLARCYLSMSDYKDALASANQSLSINDTLLDYDNLSYSGSRYITSRFNSEVLFQATATEDYYGLFSNQYVDINLDLLASYAANDLRNQVFFSDLNADGYLQFIGSYDASSTLFIGLANDEVYLTRAECNARAGNTAPAMADLNKLLKSRFSNSTPYVDLVATGPDDALSQILAERRKELVLRGLRWTDLRRLNLDSKTATTLTRANQGVTYTLPPNDLRYTLLIPQEVISNSSMAQNPR